MHWAERYVGQGGGDCAELVRDVMRERFGREIALPSIHAGTVRARDAQILAGAEALADPAPDPREGDVVVMRAAGRVRSLGHHVGVFCDVGGSAHVLHRLEGTGTVLTPLGELARCGLEATGVYRWR